MLKRCSHCGVEKLPSEFSGNRSRPDALDLQCRVCICERMHLKREGHLARGCCADCGQPRDCLASRRYCSKCGRRAGEKSTVGSRIRRLRVLVAYSDPKPRCSCCGEDEVRFLTLDHLENGGRAHRRLRGTQGVYLDLVRTGFPPGFQVLCFNCNLARGFYGACPHEAADLAAHLAARGDLKVPEVLDGRHCTRCQQSLPVSAFYADKGGPGGLQSRCRTCTREASIERLRAARKEALAHYSNGELRCQCCGEREEMFLALDHINGNGPRQPGGRGGGNSFYAWLRKHDYPGGLRVLCHSCNCAMGRDRQCPHELGATDFGR